MMDIFLSTANYISQIQQDNLNQTQTNSNAQKKPVQEPTIDLNSTRSTNRNNNSSGLDSLGNGNVL